VEINNIVDTLGTSLPLFTARSGIVVLPSSELTSSGLSNNFIGLLFLSIFLVLLLFNRPIRSVIGDMYKFAFFDREVESLHQLLWMGIIRVLVIIVSSFIFSLVIYRLGLMPNYFSKVEDPIIDFFSLIGIFCGYFIFKQIVVFFISKVFNKSYFKGVISSSTLVFLFVSIVSIIIVLIFNIFDEPNLIILRWIIVIMISLMTLIYFFLFLRILLSRQVSIFYSILYLCTMDILPIGIFLSILLSVK